MPDVLPLLHIGFQNFVGEFGGTLIHLRRKLMRQFMLAQGNFDLHPGRCIVTQNFDDTTNGLGVLAWLLDDYDHYYLARPGAHGFFSRYQNILADTPVLRLYKQNSVIGMQSSDQLRDAALQHFDNGSFPA